MKKNIDKLIDVIKQQAEIFLLDAKEFYPFGSCIDKFDKIVPVGAYIEEAHPSSDKLISLLEKDFLPGVNNGEYQVAAIAIDILIRKGNYKYDGIELRFFERNKEVYKKYFIYNINKTHVDFLEYDEQTNSGSL